MYVILTYDIKEERVAKVLKICRKYLYWVQKSVFEGEITVAKLEKLKTELRKIINLEEDSILIYTFRTTWYTNKEVIGVEKGGEESII